MLKLFVKSGLMACLLLFVLFISGKSNPYPDTTDEPLSPGHHESVIMSDPPSNPSNRLSASPNPDSSSIYPKYEDTLSLLVDYFGKKELHIDNLLRDSRFEIYEGIGDKFKYSAERKSLGLEEYKKILRFEDKRSRIIDFIHTHADQLVKAEETYGISRHIISAIIGIESDFGTKVGSYNPFNTYVSMYAVGYREKFARAQLEELLIWVNNNDVDVFELKSSYAGAMAYAQFIPYSLNKWFVGDDIFDMNNNILSVANYLAYFKKRTGSVEKAVYRYNPSSLYTSIVMDLAKEAEHLFSETGAGR